MNLVVGISSFQCIVCSRPVCMSQDEASLTIGEFSRPADFSVVFHREKLPSPQKQIVQRKFLRFTENGLQQWQLQLMFIHCLWPIIRPLAGNKGSVDKILYSIL